MARKPYSPDSTGDDRNEVANLLFHLGLGGNRLCDLFPQQDPETPTQPVDRDINGARSDAAFGRQVRSRGIAVATREEALKRLEELALAGGDVFMAQYRHRPLDHGKRPAPLEDRLRCPLVGRFERV